MIIFFNQEVIKPLKDIVVLNFFIEKTTGKTVYIRDTRQIVYPGGAKKLNGGVDFYTRNGDYYIDIIEGRGIEVNGSYFGVFIGEGFSFNIKSGKEPIFTVAQKDTGVAAASNIFKQDMEVKEMMLGMFYEDTEITYKRSGYDIKDKIISTGWKRVYGPPDEKLGIISASDAQKRFLAEEAEVDSMGTSKKREEEKYRIKQALEAKEIPEELGKSILALYGDMDDTHTHLFLASDIKDLKSKQILL